MTDEIKVNTKNYKVAEEVTVESITVGPNVDVIRTTVVRQRGGHKTTTEVTESVRYLGKTDDEYFGQFCVVDPALPEKIRMTGWFRDTNDFKNMVFMGAPFTHILEGKPYVVVRLKSYDHTMYDVENLPLPVGMNFNYIDGGVANDAFFLTGLVDHLKTREDVTLIAPRWADEGKFIHNIPSYNRSRGRDRHLEFIWHPDVETYRKFQSEVGSSDHWRRYDIAHTLMGNDAFRKPPKESKYDDEDDDDDYY